MTKGKAKASSEKIEYPRLHVNQSHQLIQVDIVPHYLRGGESVACFNGIDVNSRYPTGQAFAQRRAEEAKQFLIQVWQEIGLPRYTQVDNEACFSGGFTHKAVLGQVVRLALWVGTELVFSPVRHPESNGTIERFHQDYDDHVWHHTSLQNLAEVNPKGPLSSIITGTVVTIRLLMDTARLSFTCNTHPLCYPPTGPYPMTNCP